MELFGILFSIPAAFVATAIYCFPLRWLLRKLPWLTSVAVWFSSLILTGLLIEWALLATLGAVRAQEVIGPAFNPAHTAVFFFSVPALATILVAKRDNSLLGSWFIVALLCAIFALPVILTQFSVSEALYGIDGHGRP